MALLIILKSKHDMSPDMRLDNYQDYQAVINFHSSYQGCVDCNYAMKRAF